MSAGLSKVDGRLLLQYVKGAVWFSAHVTETDMRNLRKQIDEHVPELEPKPKARRVANPLARVFAGTTVEFVGYDRDYPGDSIDPTFEPGDRLTVVERERGDDGFLYSCVREEDYEQYRTAPDNVYGDQLVPSEIRKIPKDKKGSKSAKGS